jgi:hypothetical protein
LIIPGWFQQLVFQRKPEVRGELAERSQAFFEAKPGARAELGDIQSSFAERGVAADRATVTGLARFMAQQAARLPVGTHTTSASYHVRRSSRRATRM